MIMSMSDVEQEIQTISITREIEIAAPIEIAFEALLEEIGPSGQMPDGKPFPMVIEQWPGGRWYRDLGNNITPKGRNETGPHHNLMDWVRHHDKYVFTGFVDATSLYRTGKVAYETRT
jgi:hypothetical protein